MSKIFGKISLKILQTKTKMDLWANIFIVTLISDISYLIKHFSLELKPIARSDMFQSIQYLFAT